ncbi:MAG: tetratricopeptide repeat protein [Balneolaceae bacterium]|nr:tetratricopeptide repeat protein [Balneolaceae bacterium]
MGIHRLKNIERPVSIYAVCNKGLAVPKLADIQAQTGSPKRRIAVLPFVNMSIDPENEYFSDGITEEIINALTRVEDIEITSRTSAFAFKGLNMDIRQIGEELSVRYILEGSVRKAANRVRITAQLIDTEDGFHIWSEVFDRYLEDIFKVQDEISRKIAAKLKDDFSDADVGIQHLIEPSTDNVRAYNKFLKGNYYLQKWTPESVLKAIRQYEKAIALCPDYAEAYAGIANCYTYLGAIGRLPPQKAYPKAEAAALKSIQINDMLADSHVALTFVRLFHYWDFKGARQSIRRAKAISGSSSMVSRAYALYLKIVGKNRAAIRELEEALSKDPLSLTINSDLARAYLNRGQPEEALKQYRKTIDLDENFRSAIEGQGWTLVALGKYEEALKTFRQYHQAVGHELQGITPLGYLHGLMGDRKQALHYLSLIKKREQQEPELSLAMDYAVIFLGVCRTKRICVFYISFWGRCGKNIFCFWHSML